MQEKSCYVCDNPETTKFIAGKAYCFNCDPTPYHFQDVRVLTLEQARAMPLKGRDGQNY